MKRRTLLSLLFAGAGALGLAAACGPSGFQSSSVIDSVRILATRADNDKSYAKPGDAVTLEMLMVDGRTNKTPAAVAYWIPFVCENPIDDAYYGCFAPLLGGDAGGGGGQLPSVVDAGEDAGADITSYLPTGPFTFQVPADAITSHPVVNGTPPYGLIIIFNIACAGHVKVLPIDPAAGPQQIPIGCFDSSGNALGPDQYVIGFTRVYVSLTKTNANPVITGFVFNSQEEFTADAGGGNPSPISVTMPACSGSSCNGVPIDTDVPLSSWAPAPKAIWVDYYSQGGSLGDDARLLYDQTAGRVFNTVNPVTFSDDAGTGATIWAVVHDSNDGVTWAQVNVAP